MDYVAATEKVRTCACLGWIEILNDGAKFCAMCHLVGVLCGGCTNNTGYSALLNRCVTCEDINTVYIAVLSEFLR